MAAPIIWSGSSAKLLKPILDFFGQAQILSGTVDPTSVATSAPKGSLYLNTSTGLTYRKTDSGSSTNWQTLSDLRNFITDTFSGNGSQTAFTLTSDPGSGNNTFVFISGVYQDKSSYSVSGTTLTFTSAPPTGSSNIQVNYGYASTIGVPADGSITEAKLGTNAVTTNKIADGSITDAKLALTIFTKPASYTPTWTGLGTVSNNTMYWKRDNSDLILWGFVTAGTVTANAVSFTLPSGLTIDTTKFKSSPIRTNSFGIGYRMNGGVSGILTYSDGQAGATITVTYQGNDTPQLVCATNSGAFTDVNANNLLASNESITISPLRIPISQWA